VRVGCSLLCRFGCCDEAFDAGVPGSWKEELLGWSFAVFFLGFVMVFLHVVGGVVGEVELAFIVVVVGP
jgi:hypothetical protein